MVAIAHVPAPVHEQLELLAIQRNHAERQLAHWRQRKVQAIIHRQQGEVISCTREMLHFHGIIQRLDAQRHDLEAAC
jgi:hypothetical protein